MIQSKWCTVTATVCGVLAVASPAAAECAWAPVPGPSISARATRAPGASRGNASWTPWIPEGQK